MGKLDHPARLARSLGLALLVAAACASGCQHQRLAQQRAQTRLDRFAATPAHFAESEGSRPQHLANTAGYFDWYFRHQTERFGANLQGAGAYLGRDVERAGPRLRTIGQKAAESMYGRPERIEENAILLFF